DLARPAEYLVLMLYKHGAYQNKVWTLFFLQKKKRMRQHLELGQFLRKRYDGFLNQSYLRHEITVRSTDYDRTLMSAEANLAGLYPPNGEQVFSPNIMWQPIPVHTVPQSEEKLLSFPQRDCPRFEELMNETEQTEEFRNVTAANQDVLDLVRNKTGLKTMSVESAWSVYDTLFCEVKTSRFPLWFHPSQEKSRLQGDSHKKMLHDTTVAALQVSLNVFNGRQPPYASCHMIELYSDDNGSLTVSMFYRNDSTVEPYALQLPGCSLDCPLEDFVKITKLSISEDRQKECQLPSSGRNQEVIITLAVFGCLLLVLIVVLFLAMIRHKEPLGSQGYRQISREGADES
uniref:Lysosomal acid phosphatase n=1 Tax=Hippocampus comes TaxID=109280 RepID=A0A3Q2YWC5_HIPCM